MSSESDVYDRPAGPTSKALFAAGVGAVAIGSLVAELKDRERPALEDGEEVVEA